MVTSQIPSDGLGSGEETNRNCPSLNWMARCQLTGDRGNSQFHSAVLLRWSLRPRARLSALPLTQGLPRDTGPPLGLLGDRLAQLGTFPGGKGKPAHTFNGALSPLQSQENQLFMQIKTLVVS